MFFPFEFLARTQSRPRWRYRFPIVCLLLAVPQAQARDTDPKQHAAQTSGPAGAPEAGAVGPDASRAARERAAKRACLTGDSEGGVALLTDLFIDTNDPTYLFNQGRCFEQSRRYEDAIGRFREYLIKARDLSAADRADTERHIAACESYLRDKPADATPAETPTATVAKMPAPDPTSPQGIVAAPEPRPSRSGAGLRTAGLMMGSVGVAGLVTGLVLNLKVNSMSDDLEKEYDPGVDSTRKSYKTGTWIGYGAGAACLVGGVVLYSLGWMRGKKTSTVALVPAVGPNLAGTVLLGEF